jgi:hypothetical protein
MAWLRPTWYDITAMPSPSSVRTAFLVAAIVLLAGSTAAGFKLYADANEKLDTVNDRVAGLEDELESTSESLAASDDELDEVTAQRDELQDQVEDLVAAAQADSSYSAAFRNSFMEACDRTSGGQTAYCQCALDHLEAHGPADERDITPEDQSAAISACLDEVVQ